MVDFIGVAFDDVSPWGRCTVGELKALIYLAIGELTEAKIQVDNFNQYNDNTPERRRFYQLVTIVLDILIDPELSIDDYQQNLERMYGKDLFTAVLSSCLGENKFYGLTKTDLNLTGIEKHTQLIDSYKKLVKTRALSSN